MTFEQQLLTKVNTLDRRLSSMEKLLRQQNNIWLSQEELALAPYHISAKTLQGLRNDGTLKADQWRSRNGRSFQYRKEAIEALYK